MASDCRIGIDFHGVLNAHPDFFREFAAEALQNGIAVYIISGGPREVIRRYLEEYKIKYTVLWCVYDYFEQYSEIEYLPDGSFHVEDKLWNAAKAEYCRRENICLQIDDSVIYGRDFRTPYCLYDEQKNLCRIGNNTIVFTTPRETLQKLLRYCRRQKPPVRANIVAG